MKVRCGVTDSSWSYLPCYCVFKFDHFLIRVLHFSPKLYFPYQFFFQFILLSSLLPSCSLLRSRGRLFRFGPVGRSAVEFLPRRLRQSSRYTSRTSSLSFARSLSRWLCRASRRSPQTTSSPRCLVCWRISGLGRVTGLYLQSTCGAESLLC